jgi:hypothetical protein
MNMRDQSAHALAYSVDQTACMTIYVAVQYTIFAKQLVFISMPGGNPTLVGRVARKNFLVQMRGTFTELPRQRHSSALFH